MNPPSVTDQARYVKNGETSKFDRPADIVSDLREYLAGR
jgi:hypothetical protein